MEEVLSFITMIVLLLLASSRFGKCSSDVYSKSDFPEGFVFGAGISAYQWEGAVDEDGRKPSVWDTFLHSRKMDNGDIACDGYHKYKEDVQLMAETGLHAFRFSISWSRLISNGRGSINPKGLQFYKNFIQELVKHEIEPHVTLHHYDHPQYLEDDYGGWINRKIIKDFTAYADVCFREFGNHVKFWTTINEANIFSIGGYNDGNSPPGRCSFPGRSCLLGNSSIETYIVGHNLLLAHASVSRLYKQKYKDIQGGSVGFSLFSMYFTPSTSSKDDKISTQRANDFYLGWMLEPLIYGDYPDAMRKTIGSRLPVFSDEESEQVKGSSDFIGVIHYVTASVTHIDINPSLLGIPDFNSDMGQSINIASMRTVVSPWAMEGILEYIKQNYGNPPVYILENGKTMTQDLELQQKDTPRIEYLDAYIGAVLKAVRNGSDTRGYFVWSFMDLYELLDGYKSTFGLYSVNFSDPHLKRSPKLSAHWYSGFLKGRTNFLASQGIAQLHSNFSSSS
ncbi:Glycoside hydrolase family 1 [Arabidopsis thaliana x Arabidopsis arenosa]|uniref:beta-glucosidase n=1 Tax=Arabidopsis thaliana x Arabidopsis arenosa TaxID=1240361 RepID=A0A8T2C934_9BRAS|nr:Glycoside hydrolase family 1 [Arabidopsis thaliana x Arabidopsis arenosa]